MMHTLVGGKGKPTGKPTMSITIVRLVRKIHGQILVGRSDYDACLISARTTSRQHPGLGGDTGRGGEEPVALHATAGRSKN